MRHFVQYHNSEKMGYPCDSLTTFRILTNKSVALLPTNKVWLICGEGSSRKYALCAAFIVDDIGTVQEQGFTRYATGEHGQFFRPPLLLNEYAWFDDFLASQQNFSLGLREIDPSFVPKLEALIPGEEGDESVQLDGRPFDWQAEVREWCERRRGITPERIEGILSFFRLSFGNTRCPEHAWFGTHSTSISLVVGGIYLAAIQRDQRMWLLVDQDPPAIGGVGYRPVKSTRRSSQPLVWAHAESLDVLPSLLSNDAIWASYRSASSKVLTASHASGDRDARQRKKNKQRLSDFWSAVSVSMFPDEIQPEDVFLEGTKRTITVNAYERDENARARCLAHFGWCCAVCSFSFGKAYGPVAEKVIHVHHLRPLSEVGEEYVVNALEDLRPVCPNCHAVLHLRKPVPYSIQELRELLGGSTIQAITPEQKLHLREIE